MFAAKVIDVGYWVSLIHDPNREKRLVVKVSRNLGGHTTYGLSFGSYYSEHAFEELILLDGAEA